MLYMKHGNSDFEGSASSSSSHDPELLYGWRSKLLQLLIGAVSNLSCSPSRCNPRSQNRIPSRFQISVAHLLGVLFQKEVNHFNYLLLKSFEEDELGLKRVHSDEWLPTGKGKN